MANDSNLSSDPQNETTGDAITEYQSSSSHGVRANYELLADERISRRAVHGQKRLITALHRMRQMTT